METLTFRNPRLVALALLVIISAGLSAFLALGRQEDPTITNINAVITTPFPGADPGRVESLVTKPIEDEMRTIPEVNVITSTSDTGISIVQLELLETVDPDLIDQIWIEARDALEDAKALFPAGVGDPDFNSDGISAYAAIFALHPSGSTALPGVMARHADELADRLRNVPGTKRVELYGQPSEEVLVRLDADRAAALGLTPAQVSAAIAAADAKGQSGRLLTGETDAVLDVAGDIEAIERLRDVVVKQDGGDRIVRLGDLAEITRAEVTPAASKALYDGQRAVLLGVQIADGLQVDVWMERVKTEMAQASDELPASLAVTQIFDQAVYTIDRLSEVAVNMGIGMALVVGVLLITLGLRSALIVAAVLPLVSLGTIATLNILGLPLHQMSVTGLIVALGLLVDAAIVVTDEVRQRLVRGMPRAEAVGHAVRRLTVPLIASTVTTALSFVPMILLPGPAGDFVGSIAIAVVLMLFWSLFVALTITPAIAGWTLKAGAARGMANGLPSGWVGRRFRASLEWSLGNPVKAIALSLILPVMGFAAFPTLTAQFFPAVDRDQFHIEVEMPRGTALSRTEAVAGRMDALLRGTEGIRAVAWTIGESAPAFYYNIVGSRENEPGFAQALITTESAEATAELLGPLQTDLSAAFPEARILVRGLIQGPPVDAPVEFLIKGPDLTTLRELGEEARAILREVQPITIVRADLEGGAPKVAVTVDEAAAQTAGLDLAQVSGQLRAALDGVTGGSLLEDTEQLPVRVRLGDDIRGDLGRIANLNIVLPRTGEANLPFLPLSAIADVRLVPSESPISRRDGERINTVQAFLVPDILPEEAQRQAQAALDAAGFALPAGYALSFGGDADARDDTINNLLSSLGIIVTLSIATIVMTFNSFRLSVITFLIAGLSAGLSLLSLAIFNYPFGIQSVIGVIGSIGVSINATIILLTGLQASRGASAGDTVEMADVVMGSSRHILSTTLTTFGGFLPLILAGGGFWPPFAMSIAGGVLLSMVVSFYFTPPMFALLRPRRRAPEAEQTAPVLVPIAAE